MNYLKLADAFGMRHYDVTSLAELDETLAEIADTNEPILVHLQISNEEGVYPMVPAGKPIDEIYYE